MHSSRPAVDCGGRRREWNNVRLPSSDRVVERIVRRCGFTNARVGGGVSLSNSAPGPPYAETLPPKDPYAVRTIAVDGSSPIQLSDLKTFVTAAARHGGGWLPITFHNVCDAHAAD